MGIFSFLSKGSHSDYHLALDIGTEVVKALVFAYIFNFTHWPLRAVY
jgi:hypothetical protein